MSRVLFVNRFFYPDHSATSQMLFDLTRRLAAAGVDVTVICSRQLYEDARANPPFAGTVEGVSILRLRSTRFGRGKLAGRLLDYLSFYLVCAIALLRHARRGDIIVAKTDPPLVSILAWPVARLRRARLVNWLQDLFPEVAERLEASRLPSWASARLTALRDASLRAADVNVVIGDCMRDHLLQRGIPASRLRHIANWADADLVEPRPTAESRLRQALGLEGRFVVGYSGNLGRAHDHLAILEAATVLADDPGIAFLMIGGGAGLELLQQGVKDRCLSNVHFLAYQPRETLSDSLSAADVHLASLLPEMEGLIVPSKIYGILAIERPVIFIGAEDGELGRIIRSLRCGTTVACGDGEALASAVRLVRDHPEEARQQGARAREYFVSHCTADRAAVQWLGVLTRLGVVPRSGMTSIARSQMLLHKPVAVPGEAP